MYYGIMFYLLAVLSTLFALIQMTKYADKKKVCEFDSSDWYLFMFFSVLTPVGVFMLLVQLGHMFIPNLWQELIKER